MDIWHHICIDPDKVKGDKLSGWGMGNGELLHMEHSKKNATADSDNNENWRHKSNLNCSVKFKIFMCVY